MSEFECPSCEFKTELPIDMKDPAFAESMYERFMEKAVATSYDFVKDVGRWIGLCREFPHYSPMFKTTYAKKDYIRDGVRYCLGVCWGSKGARPSRWFKNVPEEDWERMKAGTGEWKYFLEKYGTEQAPELNGSPRVTGSVTIDEGRAKVYLTGMTTWKVDIQWVTARDRTPEARIFFGLYGPREGVIWKTYDKNVVIETIRALIDGNGYDVYMYYDQPIPDEVTGGYWTMFAPGHTETAVLRSSDIEALRQQEKMWETAEFQTSALDAQEDRIEVIYRALDEMAKTHGKPRPERFGGGTWNFNEEIEIWKKQVIEGERRAGIQPLTELQWTVINQYIDRLRKGLSARLEGDISFTVFQDDKYPLTVSAKAWTIQDALDQMGYPRDTEPEILDYNLGAESDHLIHKIDEHKGLDSIVIKALPDNPFVESNPEWWDTREGERVLKEEFLSEFLGTVDLGKVVGLGERIGISGREDWEESIAKGVLELGKEGIEQFQKAADQLKEFDVPMDLKSRITDLSLKGRAVEIKWGLLTEAYMQFVEGGAGVSAQYQKERQLWIIRCKGCGDNFMISATSDAIEWLKGLLYEVEHCMGHEVVFHLAPIS